MSDAANVQESPAKDAETIPPCAVQPSEAAKRDPESEAQARFGNDPDAPLAEFEPQKCTLTLERDGVVVSGEFNVRTGAGFYDLFDLLEDKLVAARSREDGAAPAPEHVDLPDGDAVDPLAAKKAHAANLGHVLTDEATRCARCGQAKWWCLEGNPCIARQE